MNTRENKQKLFQQVAESLSRQIQSGDGLRPGDRLPSETELAERFGVGRSTVRDAIKALSLQGLLEVRRGSGTYVAASAPYRAQNLFSNLEEMRFSLRDLFELRLMIEPEMAALACRRGTDEELAEILRLAGLMKYHVRARKDHVETDQAFHRAIAYASHNAYMESLLPILMDAIYKVGRSTSSIEQVAEHAISDHALIAEFLQNRDVRAARHAMALHLHRTIRALDLGIEDDLLN